jgi:hypothetical protein
MAVQVVYYQEDGATVPMAAWLDRLPAKALRKCLARLERLEQLGHELRRPEAVISAMISTNSGPAVRVAVVISHGLTKQRAVPPKEIDLPIKRRKRFVADTMRHTFRPKRNEQ